ncbi:MAG: N-acetyltransferase [Flavobacteriia bacterium]|nr:N-acetyltransferase [Flavobacteriia bacterium]
MLEIKPFTPSDLDVVIGMAREQDFAPGVGDIEIYANTDSQGVWLAWRDGMPVGCIAAVTYNPSYAFIGLFVVKPEHRGLGIGRRLWQHALKTLSSVECIGLEAAVQMVGFYEKAGFQEDCVTTRRQMLCRSDQSHHPNTTLLHRSDITVVPLREISLEAIQRYDERHEISPRPHFLELWLRHKAGNVFVAGDAQGECHGYVRIRPCLLPIGEGWRVGPWLAEDPGMASLLLNNAIDRHKGVVLIDTPGHNPSATTITTAKGFKSMGSTVRMYKGVMPQGHDRNVYGLACLELG